MVFEFGNDLPEKYAGGPRYTADEWARTCATEALRLVDATQPAAAQPVAAPALLTALEGLTLTA